jgi:oxygen-independent coproporphyrinogen-3 oxidase
LQYWHNDDYVGLGPGAHGYADGIRYSVLLSPQRYIKALNESTDLYKYPYTPATAEGTVVDRAGEMSETLIMGMRLTQEGIPRAEFAHRFGTDLLDVHGNAIRKYVEHGLLSVDDERVKLTDAGRLLSNLILREFV